MLILLGWCGLIILVTWCLASAASSHHSSTVGWKWWAVTGAVLLCFRWELVLAPFEFNPDEAHLIAGAMTLRADPVFWRSVDGITAGPLDFYPLLPAALTTGLASFTIERLIGLAGVFGMWVFAGEAIALVAGAAIARAALLPAFAFEAFTRSPDFLFYSTEIAPLFMLSAGTLVAVRQTRRRSRVNLWLLGIIMGAVPWAKLQAIPIAATLWLLMGRHEICQSKGAESEAGKMRPMIRNDATGKSRDLLILLAAGLLPSVAFGAMATITGQAEHMLISYWLNNVGFVQESTLSLVEASARHWHNIRADGFLAFWTGGVTILAVVEVHSCRLKTTCKRKWLLAAVGVLAASLVSILLPRRDTMHHLHFLELPLILVSGVALALISSRRPETATPRHFRYIAGFLVATLLPQMIWAKFDRHPTYDTNPANLSSHRTELESIIGHYARPGERLAIWGWGSALYVDTGLLQATREGQTQPQITFGKWQSYFLKRYWDDLVASNPPVFVDTVGPGNYITNRNYAHESFPRLVEWREQYYTLVEERGGTRVFARKDRHAGPARAAK